MYCFNLRRNSIGARILNLFRLSAMQTRALSFAIVHTTLVSLCDAFLLNALFVPQSTGHSGSACYVKEGCPGWSVGLAQVKPMSKCHRTYAQSFIRMQSEWFNVRALQDLQQKIQQKKSSPEVDSGPRVILGEAPWGRCGLSFSGLHFVAHARLRQGAKPSTATRAYPQVFGP